MRALRADLEVVELRGNVDTRLRKLDDGDYDAIVLAAAGLQRLGRGDAGAPLDELVPAAGQGCLAVTDPRRRARRVVAAIDHAAAARALAAERALVARSRPTATRRSAPTRRCSPPATLTLRAFVGRADGSAWVRDELDGDGARAPGRRRRPRGC